MQIVKLFASGLWWIYVLINCNDLTGYNMDYYRIILPPSSLRPMQRSFMSSSFLFPSFNLWTQNEVLAITDDKNYTLGNLAEFFDDLDYDLGLTQYQLTKDLLILDAPGIPVNKP